MLKVVLVDNGHASLFLVSVKNEMMWAIDRIDFTLEEHLYDNGVKILDLWVLGPSLAGEKLFIDHPEYQQYYSMDDDNALSEAWERGKMLAKRIESLNLTNKFGQVANPELFNCRVGAIACLRAMGFEYKKPQKTPSTSGAQCDFEALGIIF